MSLGTLLTALAVLVSVAGVLVGEWRHRHAFRVTWYKEVVAWARECVRAMSAAHELCGSDLADRAYVARRRHETLESLTSLIDEGRFLFENDRSTGHGANKPYAYQGHRPDVLNFLVEAYEAFKESRPDGVAQPLSTAHLVTLKELFVSDIQKIIEPNWFARAAIITPGKRDD